jgi:predicted RNA-binding Zn ribbon-like protein
MEPLYLGGHPAIDFLNTAYGPEGERREMLSDGRALLTWLRGAGMIDDAGAERLLRKFGGQTLDTTASEARKMREWLRAWLESWRSRRRADYSVEIARLNKLLARETFRPELIPNKEGLQLTERGLLESADALLALIARSVAQLIVQEDPSLIRACAGTHCTLWFLDRTKGHRRRFCSQSACGNRAKVAAFRERNSRGR